MRPLPALVFGLLILAACSSDPAPSSAQRSETDLERLGRLIAVPPEARTGRWIMQPTLRGKGKQPEGADYVLFAALEPTPQSWERLLTRLGPATPGRIRVPTTVASALLPPATLAKARQVEHETELRGTSLRAFPFSRGVYRATKAIRIGDVLFVVARTL